MSIPNTAVWLAMIHMVQATKRECGDYCQAEVTCTKCDTMHDVDTCYIDKPTQTVLCEMCRKSQLCSNCLGELDSDPVFWNGSLDRPLCNDCVDTRGDDEFERRGDR